MRKGSNRLHSLIETESQKKQFSEVSQESLENTESDLIASLAIVRELLESMVSDG
jgi:hypothetical protein